MSNKDWPVSTTGGEKISGQEAAKILNVSYTTVHNLIKRGRLKRAEARNPSLINQPLKLFKTDVLALTGEDTPASEQSSEKKAVSVVAA
jgi:excisionase family DNA binding protein